MNQLFICTYDGNFYHYSIDLEKGGECFLKRQFSVKDDDDEGDTVDGIQGGD